MSHNLYLRSNYSQTALQNLTSPWLIYFQYRISFLIIITLTVWSDNFLLIGIYTSKSFLEVDKQLKLVTDLS